MNFEQNNKARKVFKIIGPILLLVGIVMAVVAFVDFFKAFGSDGLERPDKFYLFFIGFPLIAFGGAMTGWGYMRHIASYASSSVAPVAADTINYMADSTRKAFSDTVKTVKGGDVCPNCGKVLSDGAKFCDNCGQPAGKQCAFCGARNDSDSNFCSSCGKKL